MTTEEKARDLLKRWNELYPKVSTPPPAKVETKKKAKPPADIDLSDQKIYPDASAGYRTYPTALDYVRALVGPMNMFDSRIIRDLKVRQNDNPQLLKLKEPITWVGNIAVGESLYIKGWFVVPPRGLSIAYTGENAKEKAIERAESMKPFY